MQDFKEIIPVTSKIEFKSFANDDTVIRVRQPFEHDPALIVIMEDAYENCSAEIMSATELWTKYGIKI